MPKKNRTTPVVQRKKDPNKIIIDPADLPKVRGLPIPPGQRFHNRDYDLARGHRRHPKHRKGNTDE